MTRLRFAMARQARPFAVLKMLAGVAALVAAEALVVLFVWSIRAHAHDAPPSPAQPNGWTYPWSCCSSLDCQEVADSAIGEPTAGSHGYTVKRTGEFIAEGDKRIKDSPDGLFHWCAHSQGVDAGKTICLFRPGRGS